MSHARKKIRDEVARLLNVAPVNWGLITPSRINSTRQIWPYLMVYAESEGATPATVSDPYIYSRSLSLAVVGLLRLPGTGDTSTIEDKMDALAEEVEKKLTSEALRVNLSVQSVALLSTVMDVFIEEDNVDHAEIKLTYQITYSTVDGLPDTLI